MTHSTFLLHQHPQLWRASDTLSHPSTARVDSGYPALNSILAGGFPASGLVRIRSRGAIGEVSVFRHLIAHNPQQKLLAFINPPGKIHQNWLSAMQAIDTAKAQATEDSASLTQVIYPQSPEQCLWATEQCLKSQACYLVIVWQQGIEAKQARRLQVAAAQHHTLCLLYEPCANAYRALPVALDLELAPRGPGLSVTVHKNTGSWGGRQACIEFSHTPTNHAIYRAMNNHAALQALAEQVG